MIQYVMVEPDSHELVSAAEAIRYEMLREVNALPPSHDFDADFRARTRDFFLSGGQLSVLAVNGTVVSMGEIMDNGSVVGCGTICYTELMPTFDHPTGHRAHLMNIYVRRDFRRRGIAREIVKVLVETAKSRGVTEISLDATASGRPLYESLGFVQNNAGMILTL